ncbi:cell division protein ZapE [Arthrobacter sp. RCC_34]|uniref:cell division protein ZapE n=1 Tax=Arthrobacter sp. RCC_34 TaxID=3239230 RepID=UPI0035256138
MLSRLFRSIGETSALPTAAAVRRNVQAQGRQLDEAQEEALDRLEAAGSASIYLWGAVGRGKSWLLEEHFTLLPVESRQRVHLHTFLSGLQSALAAAPGRAEHVLADYRTEAPVLLFDEFLLHDVADAHLLNRWLPRALGAGVRILATSNYPPHSLLPDPLFHEAALPAIRAIESGFQVIELTGTWDHRRTGTPDGPGRPGWLRGPYTPSDSRGRAGGSQELKVPLGGGSRSLRAGLTRDGVFVVEFARLCEDPLSAQDYLVLARQWRTWAVTGVPGVERLEREPAQRWAHLVDVLYDERVDVLFASESPLPSEEELALRVRDAARFVSRLRHLAERPFA